MAIYADLEIIQLAEDGIVCSAQRAKTNYQQYFQVVQLSAPLHYHCEWQGLRIPFKHSREITNSFTSLGRSGGAFVPFKVNRRSFNGIHTSLHYIHCSSKLGACLYDETNYAKLHSHGSTLLNHSTADALNCEMWRNFWLWFFILQTTLSSEQKNSRISWASLFRFHINISLTIC